MLWLIVAAGCAFITSPTHKPQLAARRRDGALLPRAVPIAKSVEYCWWKEDRAVFDARVKAEADAKAEARFLETKVWKKGFGTPYERAYGVLGPEDEPPSSPSPPLPPPPSPPPPPKLQPPQPPPPLKLKPPPSPPPPKLKPPPPPPPPKPMPPPAPPPPKLKPPPPALPPKPKPPSPHRPRGLYAAFSLEVYRLRGAARRTAGTMRGARAKQAARAIIIAATTGALIVVLSAGLGCSVRIADFPQPRTDVWKPSLLPAAAAHATAKATAAAALLASWLHAALSFVTSYYSTTIVTGPAAGAGVVQAGGVTAQSMTLVGAWLWKASMLGVDVLMLLVALLKLAGAATSARPSKHKSHTQLRQR